MSRGGAKGQGSVRNPVGAHVPSADPIGTAAELEAEAVQVFLGSPRGWRKPAREHRLRRTLTESGLEVFVHAPYLVNVCSGDETTRQRSIESIAANLWSASSVAAKGLVVHGGHATDGGDAYKRWRQAFSRLAEVVAETGVVLLVENTAGGDAAAATTPTGLEKVLELGNKAVRDWKGESPAVQATIDTCHAWAAGWTAKGLRYLDEELVGLIHANGSADGHGSRRDHHINLVAEENRVADFLLQAAMSKYAVPAVVETPGGIEGQYQDIAYLKKLRAEVEA